MRVSPPSRRRSPQDRCTLASGAHAAPPWPSRRSSRDAWGTGLDPLADAIRALRRPVRFDPPGGAGLRQRPDNGPAGRAIIVPRPALDHDVEWTLGGPIRLDVVTYRPDV